MSREVNNLYEFGGFSLDAEERVLRRGDQPVALPPKVFETLFLLVERHGHVISKSEMMNALWADSFVEESNLTQNIYTLRRILGTDENGKNFIENVPRRGYRFTAPVRIAGREEGERVRRGEEEKSGELSAVNGRNEITGDDKQQTTGNGLLTTDKIKNQKSKIKNQKTSVSPSPLLPFSISFIWLGVGAMLVAVLGIAGFRLFSAQTERKSLAPIETVNFRKLTFTGDLLFPVLAPDGNRFAFVRGDSLFVQDVNSGDEMRLNVEGEKVFGILQFPPDGESLYFRNRIAFDAAADVFEVSRFGGRPGLVAENVWSGFGFSPDGKRMAFIRVFPAAAESSLIVKDLKSGAETKLTSLRMPDEFLDNGYPAFSPDGKKIAVVVFKKLRPSPVSELIVVDVESGNVEEIKTPTLQQFEQIAWLPSANRELVISARENGKFFQLWRLAYPGGNLQKITNDLNIYRGVSLSADGRKLLARQFALYSHLWISEATDFSRARQKTFGNLNRDGLAGLNWTPTGDVLYVARIMGDYDVWLYRAANDSRLQLTKNAGELNQNPVATADGKHVFFSSNRNGARHIWRMEAGGANQTQITFGEKETGGHPQVSPDNAWLYYIQKGATASTIRRKSLNDERAEALTEPGKLAPDGFLSLSPDGKFLAFHNATEKVINEESKQVYQIGIIAVDKPHAPKFLSIAASRLIVRWTPDGKALDYIENSAEAARIWRQPMDEKQPPTVVLQLPKAFLHNFAWSADGEKLVLSRGQQLNDAILLTNFQP